jgi:hypothetical protein
MGLVIFPKFFFFLSFAVVSSFASTLPILFLLLQHSTRWGQSKGTWEANPNPNPNPNLGVEGTLIMVIIFQRSDEGTLIMVRRILYFQGSDAREEEIEYCRKC